MSFKADRRMFAIRKKEAGVNSYYVAIHTKSDGTRVVFTRKSLSSLTSFLRQKNDDFVVHCRW